MSGGKGGSQTSAQEIPKWLEDAVIQNLNQAKSAAEIGYVPYYGQDVAALSPMEQSAMQGTMGAMSAFGMAPKGAQYQSSLPEPSVVNGMRGYRSGDLYDAALQELSVRAPDQAKRYTDFYKNLSDTPMISNAPANANASGMAYNGDGSGLGYDGGGNDGTGGTQQSGSGITSLAGLLSAVIGGTPGDTRAPVVNMNMNRSTHTTNDGGGFNDGGTGVGVGGGPVGPGGGNAAGGFSHGGW